MNLCACGCKKTTEKTYIHGHNKRKPRPTLESIENNSISIPECGCWIWMGRTTHKYGEVYIDGKQIRIHRFVWELYNGPIPKGMNVLHRCDTPPCWNPYHLFLGTQHDNMQDKMKKGRAKGFEGKLTEQQIISIRSENGLFREIAKKYNVTRTTVGDIKHFKTWRNIL